MEATRKYEVDIKCKHTLKQARRNTNRIQLDYDEARKGEAAEASDTLRLLVRTASANGKTVYRLGYKHYGE